MQEGEGIKQVDGIKKIKGSELKKSRELVLSSIGEDLIEIKPEEPKAIKAPLPVVKKMDAITPIVKKKKKLNLKQKKMITDLVGEDEIKKEDVVSVEPRRAAPVLRKKKIKKSIKQKQDKKKVKAAVREAEEKKQKIKKQREEKELIINNKAAEREQKEADEKKKDEQEKKKAEKKAIKEKKVLEKKRKIEEEKARKIKRKEEAVKRRKNFKEKMRTGIHNLTTSLIRATKRSLMIIALGLFSFIFIYLFITSLVVNFSKSSSVLNKLGSVMDIPIIISVDGIIDFENYNKLIDNFDGETLESEFINENIAQIFILNELFKKHNIDSNIDNLAELKKILIFDEDVNLAPINRIKKIKKIIEDEGDFVKTSQKYGNIHSVDINNSNIDDFDFAEEIKNIQSSETSDIITTQKGYYIVHCFERVEDDFSISYVFIAASGLDDYLVEASEKYKFWNLLSSK